jgi:hypothetical protein
MAEVEKTEFEFPDEVEAKASRVGGKVVTPEAEDRPEIEIVDDTPEKDKNRKPMLEAPADPTEEELESYSVSARNRLKHFSKGYHEERRAKETAIREKDEAIRVAQSIVEENKRLQGSLSQGQQALLEQAKKVVANEMEQAKKKYKDAYEAGDSDALVQAQEDMTSVKIKAERVNNYKPAPLQPVQDVVQTPQAPPIDKKAVEWQRENDWFGSDDEMTSFALGLHNKLVKSGVDPQSDDYYSKVNARVRQVFPEKFDSTETADAPTQRTTKSNVVAPATRSTAPRKVVLTQTQVNLAKRLGVPLELYARKVAEQSRISK